MILNSENCSKCKTTIGVVAYISIPCPWESPGGDVIENFMLSVSSQSCSWRVGKPPDPQVREPKVRDTAYKTPSQTATANQGQWEGEEKTGEGRHVQGKAHGR